MSIPSSPRVPIDKNDIRRVSTVGSTGGDSGDSGTESVGRTRGAKPSSQQFSYFKCQYVKKKNAPPCKNQLVKTEEVVCHEHLADALATLPALVSLRESVRAKLIDPKKYLPVTSIPDSAEQLEGFMTAYIEAMQSASLCEEGYGVAGGAYTYKTIDVFDIAYNIGVVIDSSDMRVYAKLVQHRTESIDEKVASMREQIADLLALKATYTPISELEAQLGEASALLPKVPSGTDAVMEDTADDM